MQGPEGLLEYGCQYIRDSAATMQQHSSSPVPPSIKPTDESLVRVATTRKLDPVRHRRLRLAGLDEHRSSQAILIEALDSYLDMRERFRRANEPTEKFAEVVWLTVLCESDVGLTARALAHVDRSTDLS